MISGGDPLEALGLVGVAVAVLREQHTVAGQADERVAHGETLSPVGPRDSGQPRFVPGGFTERGGFVIATSGSSCDG